MKQAIAGVAPAQVEEVTVMTVWPSIAAYAPGRIMGRMLEIKLGFYVVTLGNLLALACIPIGLALYFFRLAPSIMGMPVHGKFYDLTNRRVRELRNEINLAKGTRVQRVGGGLAAGIPAVIVWGLFQQFAFDWAIFPSSWFSWIVLIVCLPGVIAGLIPLIAEAIGSPIPVPRFSFGVETKTVELDRFDRVEIVRQPGQHWYDAGDLVFFQGDVETFRLDGVSRPEAFRQTCIKSQMAHAGVKEALARESVPA